MAGENFSLKESQLYPIALMTDPNGLLAGGGGGLRTDQISNSKHRAIASGIGYTFGDVLQKFVQFDSVTLIPTGNIQWFNVNTNTFISSPISTDITSIDCYREILTSETITVSTVPVGLTTIPATCNYVEMQVQDESIVFTYDGITIPSSGPDIGVTTQSGSIVQLQSRDAILNFNAIRQTGTDARIYVQYLQVYSS